MTLDCKQMSFAIRSMDLVDSLSLSNIERDAFPTQRPPTPFKRDIHNAKVRYLVAYKRSEETQAKPPGNAEKRGALQRVLDRLSGRNPEDTRSDPNTVGYIGSLYQLDEVHITAVGVRVAYRGKGIGELLLIAGLELAQLRGAREATLEVRVSNDVAQSLYRKYAFESKGIRPKYYTDNNEDAMIMTTPDIQSEEYKALLISLTQTHNSRHGSSTRDLGE
jgi:ribosomal-protein-alanine N-acetyltransferase